MKRNARVGWISGGLLLGAVLLGYQMLPEPQEAKAQVSACKNVPPCTGSTCCGRIISNNGGCEPRDCCTSNTTYCEATQSRTSFPFPKVTTGTSGFCISAGQEQQKFCEVYECEGAYLCGEGTCHTSPNPTELFRTKPVQGQQCPVPSE